jgi:23S rRNA (cytidine2498-2'-O)-methyltransferase
MPKNRTTTSPDASPGHFILCGCQPGAEAALREQAALVLPGIRPGAWRRGVVTFRLPEGFAMPAERLASELVFARTVVRSLGQVSGDDPAAVACAAVARAIQSGVPIQNVHVWNRLPPVGRGASDAAEAVESARRLVLESLGLEPTIPAEARLGERVLDCVIDTPSRWWVGWHTAVDEASRWPGGVHPAALAALPAGIVSRAWLKLDEAIRVFEIPLKAGQRAIELGASPGGACQRLLEAGLHVVGVDPALVDPVVAARPHFAQWRMRAREVPLERFLGCDWLVADMNIDPKSTLAAIGRVATARGVRLSGIIATFKIPEWSRAAELSDWLESVRSWGFEPRSRQLSTSGQEISVVALPRVVGKKPRQDGLPKEKKPPHQEGRPAKRVTRRPPRHAKRPRAE